MSHLQAPWDLVVLIIEVSLFAYFLIANAFYALTAIVSIFHLPNFVKMHMVDPVRRSHSALDEPVSMVCPAYNEEQSIVHTVRSLLAIQYAASEIIIVNDGSTDHTLDVLIREFGLERFPAAYRIAVPTAHVRSIYQSTTHRQLRVIDKDNGGKGDALNAGLNLSKYPLVLACDADSYYHPQALQWMAEPFQKDPLTVVVGGAIGVGNDCIPTSELQRFEPKLPRKMILRFQVLEYLRAFLGYRMGLAPLNALAIVSGACGLWRKSVLLEAGGYRTDTVWEDMEMTLRVHHMLKRKQREYRVAFIPYPVCWTHVPETLGVLYHQRKYWHRHLSECVSIHRRLFGVGGALAWLTMPYLTFFEWLGPVVVTFGILFSVAGIYFNFLNWYAQAVLLGLVLVLAFLHSTVTILLDEISFTEYRLNDVWGLFWAALVENIGYRQFVGFSNLAGFLSWLFNRPYRNQKRPGLFVKAYDPLPGGRPALLTPAPEPLPSGKTSTAS
jgi:cellulose synthase/poly-beta-1,6-N-acetylglucosamine synthase-like glycosyltransferase